MLSGLTRAEKSWMMYDWANSAHSVVVVTILPIFYESLTHNSTEAVARWGTGTSVAMLIIALFAPILGVLGDFQHWKKRLFTGFVILGVLACVAMAPVPFLQVDANAEALGLALLILYILSTVGFAGANLYYDSFLPEVTTNERMDRVSTVGYGLGYIGGSTIPLLIFLLMNLAGIAMNLCLSVAFGLTAVWWVVFTIPLWKNVHQTHFVPRRQGVLKESMKNLASTARRIVRNKTMLVFLLAYFFYIDGVGTIIHMSTIYGSALGIDATQMLLALLLVQVLGLPFALVYTRLAARFGAQTMVGVGILIYSGVCVFGFFVQQAWQFWVLAILVSTSQGGIQALSRSVFGKMLPEKERSSEFFGFYDIFGKFSAIMGPALFGGVVAWVGDWLMRRQGIVEAEASAETLDAIARQASPWGVLSVLLIFLVGGALYFFVLPRVERAEKKQ
ncbi:MAG TPA: MFS transporter [Candidatus Avichristensenella intestinipullorum]|uniref:MFS transporter n=1 Tax=Candidatus Avichristensenella intestinipullorum TaxID=2840693 RepID=A0A9D0YUN3_9FIRM|nr:MFS transporter [Candidatus Avichristensenella intestinipullorum]